MERKASRHGFTLMELLIVIAIIGILAGMIFPAIGYVREKARKDECLSNLRQWGIALQGYLDEHRGVFPSYGCAAVGGVPNIEDPLGWYNVLPLYIGGGVEPLRSMARTPMPGRGIKSPFLCPSESVGLGGEDDAGDRTYFSSYTLNSWTKDMRQSQLNEQSLPPVTPAAFVVFAETGDGFNGGVDLSTISAKALTSPDKAFRHARSFNVCFADGHAENVRENDAWNGSGHAATDNYGGMQWNPNNSDLSGGKQ